MTGIVAAFVEAFTELRVHRGRVLLSLFGVAVAVAALTASVGLSDIMRQLVVTSMERSSGPPATIQFSVYSNTGSTPDADAVADEFASIADRYDIRYASPTVYTMGSVATQSGVRSVQLIGAGEAFAAIHRVELDEGRWLESGDEDRLAPVVIVNRMLLGDLGIADLSQHPTLEFADGTSALIVGVVDAPEYSYDAFAFTLPSVVAEVLPAEEAQYMSPQLEMWVPPEAADAVETMVGRDLRSAFPGTTVDAFRVDYASYADQDPTLVMRMVLLAISGVILLLGALSLINIALVTVRQRVREIGIRRAFGASRGRIFFSVMLESVVATVVAGVVGIIVTVLVFRVPALGELLGNMPGDPLPPVPVSAAVTGLVVSTVVGALAGLIPAVVAVRAKVIDAIRF